MNWQEAEERFCDTSDDSVSPNSFVNNAKNGNLSKALRPCSSTFVRCEFTQRERGDIVNFIVANKAFHHLKGTTLWRRMSMKFPNHTWQSLKEHFHKKILPFIASYELSAEVLQKFESHRSSKQRGSTENRTKKSASLFSKDEDFTLLEYVEKNGKDEPLGGNRFWQGLESRKLLPGRTWHSLRERYLKHLKGMKSNKASTSQKADQVDLSSSDTDDSVPPRRRRLAHKPKISSSSSESDHNETTGEPQDIGTGENEEKNPRKKVRKLFSASSMCDSSTENGVPCTPVSLRRNGPSILDVLIRQREKRARAKSCKELAAFKKRQQENSSNDAQTAEAPTFEEPNSHSVLEASSSLKKTNKCSASLEVPIGRQNSVDESESSQDHFASCSQKTVNTTLREDSNSKQIISVLQVQSVSNLAKPFAAFADVNDVTDGQALEDQAPHNGTEFDEEFVSDWSDDGVFWTYKNGTEFDEEFVSD